MAMTLTANDVWAERRRRVAELRARQGFARQLLDYYGGLLERWIAGDEQPIVDRYLARAAVGPVLEALGAEARARCGGPRDARHCPACGGPPQLSYSASPVDDLATGPRFLACARCAASWGYPRLTCAGCGEDSSARLQIFSEHGTTSGERGSVVRGLPGDGAARREDAVFPHMRI